VLWEEGARESPPYPDSFFENGEANQFGEISFWRCKTGTSLLTSSQMRDPSHRKRIDVQPPTRMQTE